MAAASDALVDPSTGPGKKREIILPRDTPTILVMLSEQIGYWFSDANLRKDRYLLGEAGPLGDGPVAIASIAGFNRVKCLTSDLDIIRQAIASRSEELALSDDGLTVRRRRALPTYEDSEERTVRVDGLKGGCSYAELRAAFSPSGAICYAALPRHPSGDPKGHGRVEFAEVEGACAAVKALNGATGGAAASLLPDGVAGASLRVAHTFVHDTYREELAAALHEGLAPEKAKEVAEAAAQAASDEFAASTAAEAGLRAIVHILGLPKRGAIKPLRREIKAAFDAVGELDYVDYGITESGNPTVAYVRMTTAEGAAEAIRALSATGLTLGGSSVRLELMRGDALTKYLAKMTEARSRTAHVRKAKRDAWWARKHGDGKAGGEANGGDALGEGAGDANAEDEDAPSPKRRKGEGGTADEA